MTPADRRLDALAALLVPDASAAALGRMGGPEGPAIADLARRLGRAPEVERLAALAAAMPGPLPVDDTALVPSPTPTRSSVACP